MLTSVGFNPVETCEHFTERREEINLAVTAAQQEVTDLQNRLTELRVEQAQLEVGAKEVNAELLSLRSRRSNIDKNILDVRDRMCHELGLPEADLPFAGELIQIRADEAAWQGAAERLLRGFGLSVLVPDRHYPAVSDWINDNHLGPRLVYYRVPSTLGSSPVPDLPPNLLFHKLEIKDSPFAAWIERELNTRAAYQCVESMVEFRRAGRAVTRAGQINGPGGRHEKNDAKRIDDRRFYVLGWSNEQKIDALLKQAQRIQQTQSRLTTDEGKIRKGLATVEQRQRTLAQLEVFQSWTTIDWQGLINEIAALDDEREKLRSSSSELERLTAAVGDVEAQLSVADAKKTKTSTDIGGVERGITEAERLKADVVTVLNEPGGDVGDEVTTAIEIQLRGAIIRTPADCDKSNDQMQSGITARIDSRTRNQTTIGNRIIGKMGEFRRAYPLETSEFDDSMQSVPAYRDLHRRLVEDDLPRFQARFKEYLNTNTIRDIAGFHSQLNKQVELIKERVDTINGSLVGIDYNPGRFIRLEHQRTVNVEIRDFITDLRACTDDALADETSEQYSEQRFLQVSRIIERFRGREGQTEADRAWTKRVTDVRNWFVFSASERWREDDTEHEHYADSGGKSCGQKEKLAYTILAASLAYQFKLEWDATRSRTFRFAVIDEAFGRGSDESTRFGLTLFQRLGLQLLIVTPLQKIHVIEPYVAAVGFVDNPTGAYSRVQTLTIEEYRQRQLAQALTRSAEVVAE